MFVFISAVELGVKTDSTTTSSSNSSSSSSSSKGRQLSVYEEYFEEDFIRHTETFYAKESVSFLANNPITEYLKRVCYTCRYTVYWSILRTCSTYVLTSTDSVHCIVPKTICQSLNL